MTDKQRFKTGMWIIGIILLLAVVYAYANHGTSWEGFEGVVTFSHSAACDSARANFGYPDSTNFYESVVLKPISGDSMFLYSDQVDLDSIGLHIVQIWYWTQGSADSSFIIGTWDHFAASELAVAGTGSNQVTYYAIDSVNDVAVAGVALSYKTLAGNLVQTATTNSSGYITVTLDDGTYVVTGTYDAGWLYHPDTIAVTGNVTDSILGYSTWPAPTPPAAANLCAVYGFVYDGQESGVQYAVLTFTPPADVKNICDTVAIAPIEVVVRTNDTGYFQINLLKTSCMTPSNSMWMVKGYKKTDHGPVAIKEYKFEIPADSSTLRLWW